MTSKTVDICDYIFNAAMGKLNTVQGLYNRAKSSIDLYKAKIAASAKLSGLKIQTALDDNRHTIEILKEKRDLLIVDAN